MYVFIEGQYFKPSLNSTPMAKILEKRISTEGEKAEKS